MYRLELAKRHSLNVKIYKIICIFLLIGFCFVSICFIKLNNKSQNLKLSFNKIIEEEFLSKTSNPLLKGSASNGETYNISAAYAIQKDKNKVYLSNLLAKIKDRYGKEIKAISNQAEINEEVNSLSLSENVTLTYLDYLAIAQRTDIDLKNNLIYGRDKVTLSGGNFSIKANSFDLFYQQGKLRFQGNVEFEYKAIK